jgi:hypothetical protein
VAWINLVSSATANRASNEHLAADLAAPITVGRAIQAESRDR